MSARTSFIILLAAAVSFASDFGTLARAGSSKPAGASHNNAVPTVSQVEIPLSKFDIPASPRDGRNPFFPQSAIVAPIVASKPNAALDFSSIVLNGITSPPKRTAMINGRTFERGEEGEVRLPSGAKVLIKCEEIRADSAIIFSNGQRRELRLRFGL
ncbi:MAG TPA: hypothetical protein VL361_23920 [Candidatus Limnocylindrales bacterium]|nr:hypothetical protein [Candidatus Limnocylindrales bacterium]